MIPGVITEVESVNRLKRLWKHKPNLLKKIFFGLELEVEELKEKTSETPAGKYGSGEFVLYSQNITNHHLATKEKIRTNRLRNFEVIIDL